jgi:multiple sugar transport system permease protein
VRLFNRFWSRAVIYIVLLAFTAFFVVPVIWLLFSPFKTDHQLVFENPFAFGTIGNLAHAARVMFTFEDYALLDWLKNSAIYSFGGIVIALICSIPAGYGLAHTQFFGRRTLLGITLFVMIMPATALVLPLFLEANAVHAVGTPLSVILPFSFFPFGVYLAYIFYSSSVPKDLLAAARIDGCNEWDVFRRIALPLARPIIALVTFFAFVANWNNFFLPFVMLPNSTNYPLPIGLQDLLSATPAFNPGQGGQVPIYRPELAVATIVAMAPVMIVFLFAQRSLVSGLLAGATKE